MLDGYSMVMLNHSLIGVRFGFIGCQDLRHAPTALVWTLLFAGGLATLDISPTFF